jgi:hypothetical protein
VISQSSPWSLGSITAEYEDATSAKHKLTRIVQMLVGLRRR